MHSEIQPGIEFLRRFEQFDIKMQLSTALALLYIARHQDRPQGVTTGDIHNWIGLGSAAASRNVNYWAEGTPDMPNSGLNLVSVRISPNDRRKRELRLTPRGENFVAELEAILSGPKGD